tara:strand:+ start:2423 stop:2683 length:261 start_codon:yes stop_codon:yes gene_type:complete
MWPTSPKGKPNRACLALLIGKTPVPAQNNGTVVHYIFQTMTRHVARQAAVSCPMTRREEKAAAKCTTFYKAPMPKKMARSAATDHA